MKTTHIVALLSAFAIVSSVRGQVTYPDNDNFGPPGSYLGWDWGNDLQFRTNNTTYMRLLQNGTTNINGSIMNTSGFLGLHTDFPWAMFHIQGPNNTAWGGKVMLNIYDKSGKVLTTLVEANQQPGE